MSNAEGVRAAKISPETVLGNASALLGIGWLTLFRILVSDGFIFLFVLVLVLLLFCFVFVDLLVFVDLFIFLLVLLGGLGVRLCPFVVLRMGFVLCKYGGRNPQNYRQYECTQNCQLHWCCLHFII